MGKYPPGRSQTRHSGRGRGRVGERMQQRPRRRLFSPEPGPQRNGSRGCSPIAAKVRPPARMPLWRPSDAPVASSSSHLGEGGRPGIAPPGRRAAAIEQAVSAGHGPPKDPVPSGRQACLLDVMTPLGVAIGAARAALAHGVSRSACRLMALTACPVAIALTARGRRSAPRRRLRPRARCAGSGRPLRS
jgi:hypothetical protein